MLGYVSNEMDYPRTYTTADVVLDLRKVKEESEDERTSGGYGTDEGSGSGSPPPNGHPSTLTSPLLPPALALSQRVLAAADGSTPGAPRPFKAYPKDPLALIAPNDAYLRFREAMLTRVRGGKCGKKRPGSPPQAPSSSGGEAEDKDAAYWERRRRNNEAAKRSRDARRAKEDEIAIRAAYLEQENLRLKYQIAALTDETSKLKCLLYKADAPSTITHHYPPSHTYV